MNITTGDATIPQFERTIIAHVCNDAGKFNAGFAKQIAEKYPLAKQVYLNWHHSVGLPFRGVVWTVVDPGKLIVANMIAMRGVYSASNPQPLDMNALRSCLREVAEYSYSHNYAVQMPKIGAGLARGSWLGIAAAIDVALPNALVMKFSP
jgi:O-acetyl-ADP-ribose deacetylase (regulator of RNase III)